MKISKLVSPNVASITIRTCSSPGVLALLVFTSLYLVVLQYFRLHSYRDPTSYFFDPTRAYMPEYSSVREGEADAYIQAAATAAPYRSNGPGSNKTLCVGIASVAREGARYFRTSVGSVLEGLTEKERESVFLILFIAHTDPAVHPAFTETWLHNVPDRVLTYELLPDELDHIRKLEGDRGLFREKALFDYTYLLKACSAVGTPYIAMLEDDVIALDGWYHRTQEALEQVVGQSVSDGGSSNFTYLRLFYTEEFLGWNSEEWPRYLFNSSLWVLIPALCLLGIRHFFTTTRRSLSNEKIMISCGICIPLCILLFFAAGRITVAPLPTGINQMNNFGCCSQGLVFSHNKALDLIEWYETKKVGFVDMLTEEYADIHDKTRWALTPSVLQHVGRKSSKGDDFGKNAKYHMSVAEKIWNFGFEKMDAKRLREEHARVAGTIY